MKVEDVQAFVEYMELYSNLELYDRVFEDGRQKTPYIYLKILLYNGNLYNIQDYYPSVKYPRVLGHSLLVTEEDNETTIIECESIVMMKIEQVVDEDEKSDDNV